ncbi:MAG: hypothetical protein LBR49_04070 [Tannerella sp.]|jgi:hypothetical protein|nr:hypothetical protein [Tannerella sp.]
MKTNKFLYLLVAAALLFTGCNKDDDDPTQEEYTGDESPGDIPGFGENGQDLRGKTFILPDGITFDGYVMGYEEGADYDFATTGKNKLDILNARLNTENQGIETRASVKADITVGSGGLVTVLIKLKNSKSSKVDVEFPAGLIFESASGDYQNGILLKKCKVTVPASSSGYFVVLHLYCGNLSRHASDGSARYNAPIITDSELILYLCGLVKNKKINIEEGSGLLEQITYAITYYTQVLKIQTIVWKVTDNGEMPNEEDLKYLRDLPNS